MLTPARWILLLAVSACGDGTGGNGRDAVPSGAEVCTDGQDNDGDSRADCADVDCSGHDGCPVCGAVEHPEVPPFALPDGVSSGATCSTDAQCTNAAMPSCVAEECHASYKSALDFVGFPQGATLTDPNLLKRVCVEIEHSYLGELQIELLTPSGAAFILHEIIDRESGDIFLGDANDYDDLAPVPGTGMKYCWSPNATITMNEAADATTAPILPAGEYRAESAWNALTSTTLNGIWAMRVTDVRSFDNGFLFGWSLELDPTLVSDCSGPIVR